MAELTYRKVSPLFWTGDTGRIFRKAGPDVRLAALYLLTGPHSHMSGIYYLPVAYLANDLDLTLEGASKVLQRCIEAGFCKYDESAEIVWIVKMSRIQVAEKLPPKDNRVKFIQNHLRNLPNTPLKAEFIEMYTEAYNLEEKDLGKDLPKDLSKPVPVPVAETVPSSADAAGDTQEKRSPYSADFEEFWTQYPDKTGKAAAWRRWQEKRRVKQLPELPELLDILETHKAGRKFSEGYVPNPATWLNQNRWDDVVEPAVGGGAGKKPPPREEDY